MFSKLELINYESHDHTVMNFVPGINAIIGPTDQGKSGIMRSLVFAIDNSPTGDAMISDWTLTPKGAQKKGESTEVHIHKGEDVLKRIKSSELNGYTLSTLKDPLKALRSDIPQQVQDFFNFAEVNIQNQLDQHFLITQNGQAVAKFFNEMVNLTDLDKAQSIINKRKLSTNAKLKICNENIKNNTAKLEQYNWIDDIDERIAQLKLWSIEITELETSITSLESEITKLKQYDKELKSIRKMTALAPEVQQLQDILLEGSKIRESVDSLQSVLQQYAATEAEFKKYAAFDIPDLKQRVDRLQKLETNIKNRETRQTRLKSLYNSLKEQESQLTANETRIETLKASLPEEYPCEKCGSMVKVGQ